MIRSHSPFLRPAALGPGHPWQLCRARSTPHVGRRPSRASPWTDAAHDCAALRIWSVTTTFCNLTELCLPFTLRKTALRALLCPARRSLLIKVHRPVRGNVAEYVKHWAGKQTCGGPGMPPPSPERVRVSTREPGPGDSGGLSAQPPGAAPGQGLRCPPPAQPGSRQD